MQRLFDAMTVKEYSGQRGKGGERQVSSRPTRT
jgi:hypothetical protein